MGLKSWISSFFKDEEDFNVEDYEYSCPRCGSKRLVYGSVIGNFTQSILNSEERKYVQTATCLDCGFSVKSELGDTSDNYLKQLTMTPKEK